MSFFKGVGKFFTKTVKNVSHKVEDIKEDIDEVLPDKFTDIAIPKKLRDELKTLRKANARKKTTLSDNQETLEQTTKTFIETKAKYSALLEDYESFRMRSGKTRPALSIPDLGVEQINNDVDKILKDIGKGARGIASFVTFDVSEVIIRPFEAPKERNELKEQNQRLDDHIAQLKTKTGEIQSYIQKMEAAIKLVETELKAHGLFGTDEAADELRLQKAKQQEALETAKRMIVDGIDPETASRLTGIPVEKITSPE